MIDEYELMIQSAKLETMKDLYNRDPMKFDWLSTFVIVMKRGDIDMIKWVSETYPELLTGNIIDYAARKSHLHVIKWFHEKLIYGCTTDAMDYAAKHGQLDIIKWLHQHRSEGCTTNAMDFAAMNGHFEVVKWLHKNRKEGCTVFGIIGTVSEDRLDIAFYLLKEYPINVVMLYDDGYQKLIPLIQESFRNLFSRVRAEVIIKRTITKKIVYHPNSPYIRRLVQGFS